MSVAATRVQWDGKRAPVSWKTTNTIANAIAWRPMTSRHRGGWAAVRVEAALKIGPGNAAPVDSRRVWQMRLHGQLDRVVACHTRPSSGAERQFASANRRRVEVRSGGPNFRQLEPHSQMAQAGRGAPAGRMRDPVALLVCAEVLQRRGRRSCRPPLPVTPHGGTELRGHDRLQTNELLELEGRGHRPWWVPCTIERNAQGYLLSDEALYWGTRRLVEHLTR